MPKVENQSIFTATKGDDGQKKKHTIIKLINLLVRLESKKKWVRV